MPSTPAAGPPNPSRRGPSYFAGRGLLLDRDLRFQTRDAMRPKDARRFGITCLAGAEPLIVRPFEHGLDIFENTHRQYVRAGPHPAEDRTDGSRLSFAKHMRLGCAGSPAFEGIERILESLVQEDRRVAFVKRGQQMSHFFSSPVGWRLFPPPVNATYVTHYTKNRAKFDQGASKRNHFVSPWSTGTRANSFSREARDQ
jgi:hypothetical protein